MAQSPFKTDVLQIEPAAVGTRTISRETTTGGLNFIDPAYPAGIPLADLAGLQSLSGVEVVGTTYTTIQGAIDGALTGGSVPVILVPSGDYVEDLTISKDVVVLGLGYVRITNATAGPTVSITEDVLGVPRFVRLQNLTLINNDVGAECILIDGSNTFATGTITVNTAPLAAGDVLVVGGLTLTGISGVRTPGLNNFNVTGGTVTALAAEIAAALNDIANSFSTSITAVPGVGTIALEAVTAGTPGNAITLATTTVPPGGISVSGTNLTGGGGVNSEVALDEVGILGCTLVASGVGTRQIAANTVNNIRVSGGSWYGSSNTSECSIAQVASFLLDGVEWTNDFQVAYDTGNDQPLVTTSDWSLNGSIRVGNLLVNLIGEGSTLLANCPDVGNVSQDGDRAFTAMSCVLGDVTLGGTTSARFVNCIRGTLVGAVTATTGETSLVMSSVLVGAGSDAVTFPCAQPDAVYAVLADVPTLGVVANVTSKSASGFTATFSAPVTGTVFYTILRNM